MKKTGGSLSTFTFRIPGAPGPFAHAIWEASYSKRGLRALSVREGSRAKLPVTANSDPRLKRLKKLIAQRMKGKRGELDFEELDLDDAPKFHREVFRAMHAIPFGEVRSYSELAADAGSPLAFRACGQACRNCPILLFIPCHRVVSANGLGGFGGGLHWKRALLKLEGVRIDE